MGVFYKNIGDVGIEFLRDFVEVGVKVSVYIIFNLVGIGDDEFMEK